MINITNEQIEFLTSHIENLKIIIESRNVQLLLDTIDDQIINNIMGNNDEPDELGIKLQRTYDQLFNQN